MRSFKEDAGAFAKHKINFQWPYAWFPSLYQRMSLVILITATLILFIPIIRKRQLCFKAMMQLHYTVSKVAFAFVCAKLSRIYNTYNHDRKTALFESVQQQLQNYGGPLMEVGIGSGSNLEFYPKHPPFEIIGIDPNKYMMKYLMEHAKKYPHITVNFQQLSGENLTSIADNSISCVISTLVLCSVADQSKVLSEIKRVLRPGGKFFFMEHVLEVEKSWLRFLQMFFNVPWTIFNDGCQLTRETQKQIENAGFASVECEKFHAPITVMWVLLWPHISGIATKHP